MSQPILYIDVYDAGATNLQLEIRTERDEFKKKKIQYHRYTSIGNQSVPVVAPSSLKTTILSLANKCLSQPVDP